MPARVLRIAFVVLTVSAIASTASAQAESAPSPDVLARGIAPHTGEVVIVTTAPGVYMEGRLVAVAPEGLTLSWRGTRALLPWDDVRAIARAGDSPWDGTLIGAAFGAGILLIGSKGQISPDVLFRGTAVYALTGLTLDLANRARTTIYVAPSSGGPAGARCHPCPYARNKGAVVGVALSF